VNEKLWTGRRSSKIGMIFQQLNNKRMFNQLFMVETSEEATIAEDANTHTKSMEIQIESRGGRIENPTLKRRKKELWDAL
jgi:hypothetical protein